MTKGCCAVAQVRLRDCIEMVGINDDLHLLIRQAFITSRPRGKRHVNARRGFCTFSTFTHT